jgi:hypothetical protein
MTGFERAGGFSWTGVTGRIVSISRFQYPDPESRNALRWSRSKTQMAENALKRKIKHD